MTDLTQIPGMGDYFFATTLRHEHNCLDFVLQELKPYPHMGERLIQTALNSPVVRERNGACNVLEAWSQTLGQSVCDFAPEIFLTMNKVFACEVNSDLKERLQKLL